MNRVRGAVGAAAGSTLALALLVCGCVFAAMAGPALSLHTRTQALDKTVAALPDTSTTVQVTAALTNFNAPLAQDGIVRAAQPLPAAELAESTREMAHGFAALPLPLTAGQWTGLNAKAAVVSGTGPRVLADGPPKLEVVYRDTLASNGQLAAGTYASTGVPAGMLAVAATTQMAARFRHRAGEGPRLGLLDPGPHPGDAGSRAGLGQQPAVLDGRRARGPGPARRDAGRVHRR